MLLLLALSILLIPISNFFLYREVSRHYKRLLERSDTRLDKAQEEILLISKRTVVAPTWTPEEKKSEDVDGVLFDGWHEL